MVWLSYLIPFLSQQEKDMQRLKQFILKKRPQVVVVAAEFRATVSVIDDIKMCIAELEQENQIPTISVEALDGEVARVFMSSPRAEVCLTEIKSEITHTKHISQSKEKNMGILSSYYIVFSPLPAASISKSNMTGSRASQRELHLIRRPHCWLGCFSMISCFFLDRGRGCGVWVYTPHYLR